MINGTSSSEASLPTTMFTFTYTSIKYHIIMAEEQELPKISTETREKLRAMGFVNHLYDSTILPSHYIPRGCGCTPCPT
jgi:hypothetical protein